jgi:hypothetical protein
MDSTKLGRYHQVLTSPRPPTMNHRCSTHLHPNHSSLAVHASSKGAPRTAPATLHRLWGCPHESRQTHSAVWPSKHQRQQTQHCQSQLASQACRRTHIQLWTSHTNTSQQPLSCPSLCKNGPRCWHATSIATVQHICPQQPWGGTESDVKFRAHRGPTAAPSLGHQAPL